MTVLQGQIAVLDIGKTLAKISVWAPDRTLVASFSRPNVRRVSARGYLCLDVEGIETWLIDTLHKLPEPGAIEAIIPVGHGASACLVDEDGLTLEPLDYEADMPANLRASYLGQRDAFAVTGSPALPLGLNLGAQLHWLESIAPEVFRKSRIIPWPQYWSWRLGGAMASEVSSLGCHTDLWSPRDGKPSPLATKRGWANRLAPLRHAGAVLGTVSDEWQRRAGLDKTCRVLCGLHDSNAALLAVRGHPETRDSDCTVISTGTWFVMMRRPGAGTVLDLSALDEKRDCLINVDVEGVAVPSVRFMGGRETEILEAAENGQLDVQAHVGQLIAAAKKMVAAGIMAIPSFQQGVGPFPGHKGHWIGAPADQIERRAAAGLYLALMADTSLKMIGGNGPIVLEGRFAGDPVFTGALAELRPGQEVFLSDAKDSVPFGAMRLVDPNLPPHAPLIRATPLGFSIEDYAAKWRAQI